MVRSLHSLLLSIAVILTALPARAETRVALVLGNANYENVQKLGAPRDDAAKVALALWKVHFRIYGADANGKMSTLDLTAGKLREALREFSQEAARADVALVYYSGHGIQLAGTNYLLPVDFRFGQSNADASNLVPLDELQNATAGAHIRIVLYDACRDNPFIGQITGSGGAFLESASVAAAAPTLHSGLQTLFAARDGTTAIDVGSPFASAVIKHMGDSGVEFGDFTKLVTRDVLLTTKQQQEPHLYTSSIDHFYFVPTAVRLIERQAQSLAEALHLALQQANQARIGDAQRAQKYAADGEAAAAKADRGSSGYEQTEDPNTRKKYRGMVRYTESDATTVGREQYVSGSTYAGQFLGVRRNGYGVMTKRSGVRYAGHWLDNLSEGLGVFSFPAGASQLEEAGQYRNDVRQGYVVRRFRNGTTELGRYVDDKLDGWGARYDRNCQVVEQGWYQAGVLTRDLTPPKVQVSSITDVAMSWANWLWDGMPAPQKPRCAIDPYAI